MKLWILLAIAILLMMWGVREGFEEPMEVYADPICPAGTSLNSKKRCVYPGESEMFTCPSGYAQTAGQTCRNVNSTEEIPPQCPAGKVFNSNDGEPEWGCIKDYAVPTCPVGFTLRKGENANICYKPNPSRGSNSSGGVSNRSKQVFGPQFTGRGEVSGVSGMDSSKTNQYPELLGGGNAKPSTRVEGAGITNPSRNFEGSLPTTAGLGADENSKYLPFSRQPGDMDVIPDPYRVSQSFSSANYGFKTEPVPFLTDFSSFQK